MGLFQRMTVEERVREAYDTFTEEAKPYLFPAGEQDALEIVTALGEACGVGKKGYSVRQCEDLLDLWAEMVRCTELNANRADRIRQMRKKYGALVTGETVGDRVCNWCEKRMARAPEETGPEPEMGSPIPEAAPEEEMPEVEPEEDVSFAAPEEEAVTAEPEEDTLPEEAGSETEIGEEPQQEAEVPETAPENPEPPVPARPDPKAVAILLKDAWKLNGPERRQTLERLKPRRKEWVNAVLDRPEAGVRGAVGSVFLAGFVAAGGKTADQTETRDLLKKFLLDSGAETCWAGAETDWKKEVLKAAWQLGVRMGTETPARPPETGEPETGELETEEPETLTGGTEDETLG